MKRTLLLLAATVLLIVAGIAVFRNCSRPLHDVVQQVVVSGSLDSYPDFPSQHITPRNVTVWKPNGYTIGDTCRVIYMHDGQMLFDATATWNKQEWKVDDVLGQLIDDGIVPPCIVVAIDNTDNRLNEYFPSQTIYYMQPAVSDYGEMSPEGEAYLRFIVEELKPFIDDHYRPLTDRGNTFVLGSSMGGLISMYALCEYPHFFGGAVCMSTHLSFGHLPLGDNNAMWAEAFQRYMSENLPPANECLLYMDRGTVGIDEPYAPYQLLTDTLVATKGWDSDHYMSKVFEGHEHNETCWAKRLHEPLTFLLRR